MTKMLQHFVADDEQILLMLLEFESFTQSRTPSLSLSLNFGMMLLQMMMMIVKAVMMMMLYS